MLDQSERTAKNGEVDPNDTCTSDFYQVPIQGGIPVQLTIENGRRPFTPPFAQLIRPMIYPGKPPSGQSTRSKKAPEFIKPVTSVMNTEQQNELKTQLEDEPIEEEIETTPTAVKSSNQATTKDSNSSATDHEPNSRNKQDQFHTFAEEKIEYSESFKKKADPKKLVNLH